jgi:hypothetical protein
MESDSLNLPLKKKNIMVARHVVISSRTGTYSTVQRLE